MRYVLLALSAPALTSPAVVAGQPTCRLQLVVPFCVAIMCTTRSRICLVRHASKWVRNGEVVCKQPSLCLACIITLLLIVILNFLLLLNIIIIIIIIMSIMFKSVMGTSGPGTSVALVSEATEPPSKFPVVPNLDSRQIGSDHKGGKTTCELRRSSA